MVRSCDNCDNQGVSEDFHRVYSDNEGNLPGCLECMTGRELKKMHVR